MVDFQYARPYGWAAFVDMMRILRSEEGCPWDRVQTHQSIRRNFLEECYEALDALDRDDPADLCEELGDVLLQVIFHAQIEAERGRFTIDDVVDGVVAKLVFRHPHVFEQSAAHNPEEAFTRWEDRKLVEKDQRSAADAVEAVPHTLPALWRAEKISKRAARGGFDWRDGGEALDALQDRVHILGQAEEGSADWEEALGDLLFLGAKLAQRNGKDPEEALHCACDRFQQRFRAVETAGDKPLAECSPAELAALWADAGAQADKRP